MQPKDPIPKASSGTYRAQQSTLIDEERLSFDPPPIEKNRALLTLLTGPGKGSVHQLHDGTYTLGRSDESNLVIPDPSLSRVHARLSVTANREFFLEDLGSTNGTYVGGLRINGPTLLDDGVRVGFGKRTLARFAIQDALEERAMLSVYESALRDGLTGAYNRRVFDDRLESEFAFSTRHGRPLSLLLLDIDHFKGFNDTYGHQAGDLVLKRVAAELMETLRTEDLFARYGGEEFVILLRDSYPTDAAITGERVRALVEGITVGFAGQQVKVTVSVGIACNYPPISTTEQLVASADAALYEAKDKGRNRIIVFGTPARHLRPA